jgi:integrase
MKLTNAGLRKLLERSGRHGDGDGLFFRTLGSDKAYWTYRFRVDGRERELSIGPPTLRSHWRKLARSTWSCAGASSSTKADPLAERRAARQAIAQAPKTGKPTFGEIADAHLLANETAWRNPKHRDQWRMTLTRYCAPIRDTPVDQVDTQGVMRVLTPLWTETPETAARLRGRIEAVLNRARVLDLIDVNRANPARWKGHLDQLLPNSRKVGQRRGHHAAMPYGDVPAFMVTLKAAPGSAAKALMFAVLCAARSGEAMGACWSEIDLDACVWTISPERMKTARPHRVPLSAPAVDILREQLAVRGNTLHVFPGARLVGRSSHCSAKLSISRSRSRNSPVKSLPCLTQTARSSANPPLVMHGRTTSASGDAPAVCGVKRLG